MDEEDANQKTISFSDEFRRAKRNSLVWSGLALVVGFGHTASNSISGVSVAVPIFGTGLAYRPDVLAALALVGATFMIAGFLRADANVRIFSSPAALGAKAHEIAGFLDKLGVATQDALGAIHNARMRASTSEQEVDSLLGHLAADAGLNGSLISPVEAFKNTNSPSFRLTDGPETLKEPLGKYINQFQAHEADLKEKVQRHWDAALQRWSTALESTRAQARGYKERVAVHTSEAEKLISAKIAQLESLANGLKGFHPSISASERRWYYLYDLTPVWVLFLLGATSTIMTIAGTPPALHLPKPITRQLDGNSTRLSGLSGPAGAPRAEPALCLRQPEHRPLQAK